MHLYIMQVITYNSLLFFSVLNCYDEALPGAALPWNLDVTEIAKAGWIWPVG